MVGKYEINPLMEFYNVFLKELQNYISGDYALYDSDLDMIKAILMNASCIFSDSNITSHRVNIMNGDYTIYFISGAFGNNVNQCFDFIEFNGTPTLVIFLDAFHGINSNTLPSDPVEQSMVIAMGKSIFFDSISKIVNIFLVTTSNPAVFTNVLSTTSAGINARYVPFVIAGKIIKDICGKLTENDISGIDYASLLDIIDNRFELALYGIRLFNQ